MEKFTLVIDSDPILKERMPIYDGTFEDINSELFSLFQFMKKSGGIGLAAPQIGLRMNFFIMDTDGKKRCVVNPIIVEASKATCDIIEGCLSFSGKRIRIKRSAQIIVSYENEFGNMITETLNGISARCFLHEFDHTLGITFDTL